MFGTKVSVWSQDLIDHKVRGTHFGCVYRHVRYFFKRCYFLFADLCLIVWCVFFFFFGDGIVRMRTCIIWLIDCAVCGDFFFCYSLNLCEMRSVRWWKFLDILHCWCTCVLSIAFWLGSEI